MKSTLSTNRHFYLLAFLFVGILLLDGESLMAYPEEEKEVPETLAFTENKGQINPGVQYYLRSKGVGFYLKSNGLTYIWEHEQKVECDGGENEVLRETVQLDLTFLGANPQAEVCASKPISYLQHFYTAGHPEGIRNVKSFERILYEEIYPNIDLVFYVQDSQLKYDFIVKPGGKFSDIQLQYKGQEGVYRDVRGSLLVDHALGNLEEGVPYTYQLGNEGHVPVASQYALCEDVIQFQVENYDPETELIIDPSLQWATYYGGESSEIGYAVCTDKSGNVYMAGETNGYSFDFADIPGHQLGYGGGDKDAFLVKFDPTGTRLWATYYGGQDEDKGMAVCTDDNKNVYLAGYTHSDEAIAHNGHDEVYNENPSPVGGNRFDRDAFLVKFDEDGDRLWGTYYGGEDFGGPGTPARAEEGRAVCTDPNGNVYLAGLTGSEEHIAHNGHDNTFGGEIDAFLVKFNTWGDRQWATYYGKSETDVANAVATDAAGEVYLAGYTESSGMAYNGHDNSYSEDTDGFLVKFEADGTRLWATYYGDTGVDQVHSIVMDGGFFYLGGITTSSNFIAHDGHDMTYNGGLDAFLVKFNFFGTRIWGTYYGGPDDDAYTSTDVGDHYARSIGVSVSKYGDVYLAGPTKSNSGISTNSGLDPTFNGGTWDGYLARFFPDGSRQWGTYYGGSSNDYVFGTATDVSASVYICGSTYSDSQIAHKGHDDTYESGGDAFLAKIKPYGDGRDDGPGDLADDDPYDHDRNDPDDKKPGVSSLAVSPNPTSGDVRITYPDAKDGPYRIRILDKMGKMVYQGETLSGSVDKVLDLRQLKRGLYIVSFQTGKAVYTKNLVIE